VKSTLRAALTLALLVLALSPRAQPSTTRGEPTDAELQARGATIGRITFNRGNVFDPSNPGENGKIHRWANRVHVITRESVVEDILLIASGDPFDPRVLEESERALRAVGFIAEANVVRESYDEGNNTIDIEVSTIDAWTLTPELKLSRSGGENEYAFGASEENIFGTGTSLTVAVSSDVDRDETFFGYADSNVRGTRTTLDVAYVDRSDGGRRAVSVERPFYALDSRWSIGSTYEDDERIDSIYELGEEIDEFRHDMQALSVFGGWSAGAMDRRARRWLIGFNTEDESFQPSPELPDTLLLPTDRRLVYPWIGMHIVEDRFLEMTELNDMGRTEDVQLGLDLSWLLGFATRGFSSDRDAMIVTANFHRGWELGGSGRLLMMDLAAEARREEAETRNAIVSASVRYYHRNLERHLFSASMDAALGNRLDAENQILIGGDNGLRGFPLRYQSGEKSLTLTLEQRFFTDLYPFRLIRVGYAVFFDAGRVWGRDARGARNLGTLYDIGIGLRLTSPRSTGASVVHVDLAFPINGDPDIDDVQIIVEKKRSF
jgi:hypothetical protein